MESVYIGMIIFGIVGQISIFINSLLKSETNGKNELLKKLYKNGDISEKTYKDNIS
jgi:uncharacterized membrane protein